MSRRPHLLIHSLLILLMAVTPLRGLFAGESAMPAGMDHPVVVVDAVIAIDPLVVVDDSVAAMDDLCECCPEEQPPACASCAVNHCSTGHCASVAILSATISSPLYSAWAFVADNPATLPPSSLSSLFRPPRA